MSSSSVTLFAPKGKTGRRSHDLIWAQGKAAHFLMFFEIVSLFNTLDQVVIVKRPKFDHLTLNICRLCLWYLILYFPSFLTLLRNFLTDPAIFRQSPKPIHFRDRECLGAEKSEFAKSQHFLTRPLSNLSPNQTLLGNKSKFSPPFLL